MILLVPYRPGLITLPQLFRVASRCLSQRAYAVTPPVDFYAILLTYNSPSSPSLGFNVGRSAGGRSTLREINRDACHFPGLPVLQTLLPKHTNVPELYFLLMALFLQQPVIELPDSLQVHVSIPNLLSYSTNTDRSAQLF